jgi:hypothetical protein
MSRIIHMCLDVQGCLNNWSLRELGRLGFVNDDGSKATGREVKAYLLEQLSQGKKLLPMCKDCVGFDYTTGCPGHEG